MRWERNVELLSDPTAIIGEIRTKNCFGLKSKVPFIADRLQPDLQWLLRMRRDYHVVLFDLTVILGEIRTKNYFALRSRVPFLKHALQPNLLCL
jgi:hypothetical protein